ncbi:MAG: hypothetical protein IJS78_07425 [Clostridia bacterium]|nr:hypothetical protein [Clostridia bacterium]
MKNRKSADGELLRELYIRMRSGEDDLCSVTPKITDRRLLTEVTSQLEKYSEFANRTKDLMRDRAISPKEPSLASRLASRGAIAINTFASPSPSEIAGMIARGTYRGARRLVETIGESRGCDGAVSRLYDEVIGYQLGEAEKMKGFM